MEEERSLEGLTDLEESEEREVLGLEVERLFLLVLAPFEVFGGVYRFTCVDLLCLVAGLDVRLLVLLGGVVCGRGYVFVCPDTGLI